MERRGSQEIHLHVVWRQVIAGGQPGLVELHGPVGGGEQQATNPDFHVSDGWGNADRWAWGHDKFNRSGDIAIPFAGESSPCRQPGAIRRPIDLSSIPLFARFRIEI